MDFTRRFSSLCLYVNDTHRRRIGLSAATSFASVTTRNLTRRRSRASHGIMAKTASEVRLHVHRLDCSKRQS
jgi:RNase P protein component